MTAAPVAALYISRKSIYKTLLPAGACYDDTRDARRYRGAAPVIAHPPCAQYCRLKHMANKNPAEKSCARIAVWQVRALGGVLEHPKNSRLWNRANLPTVGGLDVDEFGGFSLQVLQWDFFHMTPKPTWLYVCGARVADIQILRPARRPLPAEYPHLWSHKTLPRHLDYSGSRFSAIRSATPPKFAEFLINVARICRNNPSLIKRLEYRLN